MHVNFRINHVHVHTYNASHCTPYTNRAARWPMHGANVESRRARSARVLLGWPHTGRRGHADATRKGFLAFVAPWFAPRCLAQRWGWPSLHRGLPPDVWPGGGRGLHCTLACPPHVFPVTCYGPMDWALEAQRARRRSSGYRDGPRGQDGPWWPQGGRTGPQAARRRPHKELQVS